MSTTEIARNRILELEQQLAESKTQIVMLREYLEKLACLGNGTRHGNSVGNVLAIEALDAIDKDLSGYILCDAAPVRYIYEFKDYAGRTIWSSNLEHDGQIPTATIPLYKAMKP